ncbi:hypothetical protein MMPV_006151 [Pyropia vietnamensis]
MASAGNAAVATAAAAAAAAALSTGTTPATAALAASVASATAADDGVFDHLLPAGCLLRQYFEPDSSTYTYLVGDTASGIGALIDPVDVTAVRDATAAAAVGVTRLSHAINTHVHADHVTGTGVLRRALSPPPRSVLSAAAGGVADVRAPPGWELQLGRLRLTSVATPGHTAGCQSLLLSVNPRGEEVVVVLPAHDYHGRRASTVGAEKESNARLRDGVSETAFVELMAALRLPMPKRIDVAVPANLRCGA